MSPNAIVALNRAHEALVQRPMLMRTMSCGAAVDSIDDRVRPRRSPLVRSNSSPAVLNPIASLGCKLVETLQIATNTAGEIVAAIQAERAECNMPLLSEAIVTRLENAIVTRLQHKGFVSRLGRRLNTGLGGDVLRTLLAIYGGEQGTFVRQVFTPLSHEMERARLGWQAQCAAGVPRPKRPTGERRVAIDHVMPLVLRLRPGVQGDDGLCDVLAGLLLLRLDHDERRNLRHFLNALDRQKLHQALGRISAWVMEICRQDGTDTWVLGQVDAMVDLDACERAVERNPQAQPPLRRRAELYLERLDDPASALCDMDRLVELNPCCDHLVARAKVHIQLGQWDAAQEDLEVARRLDADNAAPYGCRAMLRLKRHDIAGAQRDLARGERREPQDPDVCRAKLLIEDYQLTERLGLHPQDAQALIDRAQCRGKQSRYAEALQDCRAALALSPHNPYALAGCDWWASMLGIDGR